LWAPELLLLCLSKGEVTKRKRHPGWRLPGLLPGKSVRRGRAFRVGSCPREKASPSMGSSAARPCRPRLTAAQGPRKSRRASCAPEATAKAERRSLRDALSSCSSEKCALGARCSTRGPYGAAGGLRKVRRMARMDASQFFAGTCTCRRKTPEPARAPGRQDAWRARHRGVVSSWLLLLWTSKGEVTRAPQAHETL